jgi:hypothetical protein
MSKRASELASSTTVAIAVVLALSAGAFIGASPAYAADAAPGAAVRWTTLMFAVPFAILVEYTVMQLALLDKRALSAVLVSNMVSAVGCVLLYPIIASIAELLPQPTMAAQQASTAVYGLKYDLLKALALVPIAALVITTLKMPVLVKHFAVPPGGNSFKILWASNLASTLIIMAGAWLLLM